VRDSADLVYTPHILLQISEDLAARKFMSGAGSAHFVNDNFSYFYSFIWKPELIIRQGEEFSFYLLNKLGYAFKGRILRYQPNDETLLRDVYIYSYMKCVYHAYMYGQHCNIEFDSSSRAFGGHKTLFDMARNRTLGYDDMKSNSTIDLKFNILSDQFDAMMACDNPIIRGIIERVNMSEPNDPFYHHTFEYDLAQLDKTYQNIDIRKMTDKSPDFGNQYPTGNSCWSTDGSKIMFLPHTEAQADVRSYYFGVANGVALLSNDPFSGSENLYMSQDYISNKFGVSYQVHANVGICGHNLTPTLLFPNNGIKNKGGNPDNTPPNNNGNGGGGNGPVPNNNGFLPDVGNGGIEDDTSPLNFRNQLKPPKPKPISGESPRVKLSLNAFPADNSKGIANSSINEINVRQNTNMSSEDESKIRKFIGKFYDAGKHAFSNEKNMAVVADVLGIIRNRSNTKLPKL